MEGNKGHIYRIINTKNLLSYIGQTMKYRKSKPFGYLKRFKEHLSYTGSKKVSVLGKAIIEIGKENFNIELIEECELNNIDDRERYWIDHYNTLYPNGYNILYGPPYTQNEDAKLKISNTLKLLFQNEDIRKIYSSVHLNKFKNIHDKPIETIEIHPINQDGKNKLVYMYIRFQDKSSQRRRYGGIHIEYEFSFVRCYDDAVKIINNDTSKIIIKTTRADDCKRSIDINNITKIELCLHKMYGKEMVSIYLSTPETKKREDKKRLVFGGKTISLEDAYNSALEFVESIKHDNVIIEINQKLIAARPSNCGKPL